MKGENLIKSTLIRELLLSDKSLVSEEGLNTLVENGTLNFADGAELQTSMESDSPVPKSFEGLKPAGGMDLVVVNASLAALKEDKPEIFSEVVNAINAANDKIGQVVENYKGYLESGLSDLKAAGADPEKVAELLKTCPKVHSLL